MKMMMQSDRKRPQDDQQVPLEIDTHYHLYGKHAWEIEYGERCPACNKRIDEFGFCACGSAQ
jgi:rRNA maturation endonuclease Nob1